MSAKVLARVHREADTKAGFDLQVLLKEHPWRKKVRKQGQGGEVFTPQRKCDPVQGQGAGARRASDCMQHSSQRMSARLRRSPQDSCSLEEPGMSREQAITDTHTALSEGLGAPQEKHGVSAKLSGSPGAAGLELRGQGPIPRKEYGHWRWSYKEGTGCGRSSSSTVMHYTLQIVSMTPESLGICTLIKTIVWQTGRGAVGEVTGLLRRRIWGEDD